MANAKARAPGHGTVHHRKSDGRWMGVVYIGRGSRRDRVRKYLYGSSRDEVERLLDDAHRALEQGLAVPDPRLTVGEQLRGWLEWQRTRVRPATWITYRTHVDIHTRPLHPVPLLRLTPNDVRRWLVKLRSAREPLSDTTLRHSLVVLRMALKQAVGDGLVARNAADFVVAPKPDRVDAQVLTIDEIRRLFESIAGDRLEPLWVTAFATGLRQSELLGLRWQDVNLETGTAVVAGSLRPVPREFRAVGTKRLERADRTKSDNAYRAVPLPAFAVDQLRRWQNRQKAEPANLEDLVFTSVRGTPLDGRNTTRLFKRALADAGVRSIRFHEIRHSTSSLLRAMGLSIDDVKSILGHGSAAMTWHYTHVMPEVWRRATAAMEEALG
jgi:integrase